MSWASHWALSEPDLSEPGQQLRAHGVLELSEHPHWTSATHTLNPISSPHTARIRTLQANTLNQLDRTTKVLQQPSLSSFCLSFQTKMSFNIQVHKTSQNHVIWQTNNFWSTFKIKAQHFQQESLVSSVQIKSKTSLLYFWSLSSLCSLYK